LILDSEQHREPSISDSMNAYKRKGNIYVEDNIKEIQELFKDEESKKERGHIGQTI